MIYTELEMPKKGDKVVVGMSGGVDSTMTVMILKELGCHVTAVTMSMWTEDMQNIEEASKIHDSCYGPDEAKNIGECKKFCEEQGVPYFVVDVSSEYRNQVLEYFKAEYRNGRTPNPCIKCNQFVKFGALLAGVEAMGIDYDYFCTGHYAKVVRGDRPLNERFREECSSLGSENENGSLIPPQICSAMDLTKDQAYFLYRIPSRVLEKVRFPLSNYTKKQIYEMARERNLVAATREESQDFLPDEMLDIIFNDKPSVPGDIIDLDGKVLGRHRGIEHYTIGQRRGLGVSAKEPLYVAEIDSKKNLVVLGRDCDLFCSGLVADDLVWPGDFNPGCKFEAMVKIRLASRPVPATIEPYIPENGEAFNGDAVKVTFSQSQRAVAPGQSVVFYVDGITAGGGIISRAIK